MKEKKEWKKEERGNWGKIKKEFRTKKLEKKEKTWREWRRLKNRKLELVGQFNGVSTLIVFLCQSAFNSYNLQLYIEQKYISAIILNW